MAIEYWSKEGWKALISDYIIPLRETSNKISDFWDRLNDDINEAPFNEIEEDENLKKILLGGVKENGEYTDRSLANFYKMFFGVSLSNLQECIVSQREGITPQVTVTVKGSEFITFVKSIRERTDAILELAYQNGLIDSTSWNAPETELKEIMKDSKKIADLIKEFYDSGLKITLNHNQHTLFLWTIRKITRRYLDVAYPELENEDKFDVLKSIVGLEKYFEPEIEEKTDKDRKVRRDYTIWHLPENSFGWMICGLNEVIWEYLGKESFREDLEFLFENVIDSRNEFMEKAKKSINNWKFPENIKTSDKYGKHISGRSGPWTYTYTISGIMLTSYHQQGCSARGKWSSSSYECNIPLLTLFGDISPALFLGIADVSIINNVLEIVR